MANILKINMGSFSKVNEIPFRLLTSSSGLKKLGYTVEKDSFYAFHIYVEVVEATNCSLRERAESIRVLLMNKHFDTEIVEEVPKDLTPMPLPG